MVTGASGGLGTATAIELHRQGAQLVLTARRKELLDQLAATTGAVVVVADLASHDDVEMLCERAKEMYVLVLNAGTGADGCR